MRGYDPVAALVEFEAAVRSMEALPAPLAWSSLKSATVRELRRRLTMLKLGTMPPAESLRVADAEWLKVQQQFRELFRTRAGFWKDWPHLTRHSGP